MPESHLHDERVLPHQVLGDLEAMFPRAIAGEEEPEEPEAKDELEERGRALGRRDAKQPSWRGERLARRAAGAAAAHTRYGHVPGTALAATLSRLM